MFVYNAYIHYTTGEKGAASIDFFKVYTAAFTFITITVLEIILMHLVISLL